MRGTSMATPIVAGGLLLIRQYFTEGWYPSGAANSSRSYIPSGPLMKAVLLGDSLPVSTLHPLDLKLPAYTPCAYGALEVLLKIP